MKDFKRPPKKNLDKNRPHQSGASARYVVGRNPVFEMLKNEEARQRILKAYVQHHERDFDARGMQILNEIKSCRVPVVELQREALTNLCGTEGHQGFAVEVKERPILDIKDLVSFCETFDRGIVVALDAIQDPQNVGAILRAAECLGAKAVFWSHNRSPGITPVVTKVSAGASELMTLASVSNLRDSLQRLNKIGFWSVAAVISEDAQALHRFSFPEKCCLILGSEGGGVGPLMAKEADFRVYIQQYGAIDSLNVSQASAVFLEAYARQYLAS